MSNGKSSLSNAESYAEMGAFWDSHSLADVWDQTNPVEFEMDVRSDAVSYSVPLALARQVRSIAKTRGVPTEALLTLWVQEKAAETLAGGAAE